MLTKVAKTIVDVAKREDQKLKQVGRGIFLMQELAFTYQVGLELALNAKDIFGTDDFEWWTEKNVDPDSRKICDLVFQPLDKSNSDPWLIIEFKSRGSGEGWVADIDKFRNLHANFSKEEQGKYKMLFCALVDVNCDQVQNISKEKRVSVIDAQEAKPGVKLKRLTKGQTASFETQNYGYASPNPISCFVGVWQFEDEYSTPIPDQISF